MPYQARAGSGENSLPFLLNRLAKYTDSNGCNGFPASVSSAGYAVPCDFPNESAAMLRSKPVCALLFALLLSTGCATLHHSPTPPLMATTAIEAGMPRELSKTVMPEYVIEPPDILTIEALQLLPKPPYRLRTGDQVFLEVTNIDPEYPPISENFIIQLGGSIDLGPRYGTVPVANLTIEEAEQAIREFFLRQNWRASVTMSLIQMAGMQQIAGQHLVGPDGKVNLGVYGTVSVVGLTLPQAREKIESHLSEYLEEPEIALDMFAYNSKVYYVVTEGAGMGDNIIRMPFMGNETVLDAMSNIGGMSALSSKHIWIARPTPYSDEIQILPIDWVAITRQGSTMTNYQVLPGDRIFIAENKLVALDTNMGKLFSPVERMMGFSMLTLGTLRNFSGSVLSGRGIGERSF